MSYFSVRLPDDTLPWYVWADNAQHAVRKVENMVGDATLNGRSRYRAESVMAEEIPPWYDIDDEPADEKAARMDGAEG